MTPKKLLEIAEKETAHPLLLGVDELIPILKAAMKMAEALEDSCACPSELNYDGTFNICTSCEALSEWEKLGT